MQNQKRYFIVFTGKLKPGMDKDTVVSNLVLSVGIPDARAKLLLENGGKVLKNCATSVEAELFAEKLTQAGLLCTVHDRHAKSSNPGVEVGSESSLVRMLRRFAPAEGDQDAGFFSRLIGNFLNKKSA